MLANESRARDFSAGPSDSLEFITGGSSRLSILSTGEFVLNDLSPSSALILDASGGVISSTVTSIELGYLEGVTSNIQSQIDSKSESADVVTLATDQTITGGKDFTGRLAMVTTSTASLPCPVMTSTERDALNPVKGDCVFNSTTDKLNVFDTAWSEVGGGGSSNVDNSRVGTLTTEGCIINNTATPTTDSDSGLCASWVNTLTRVTCPIAGGNCTKVDFVGSTFANEPVCNTNCTNDGCINASQVITCWIDSNSSSSVWITCKRVDGADLDVPSTLNCKGVK